MPLAKHLALPLLLSLVLVLWPHHAQAGELRWLDAGNKLHSLEDYRGKPVLVHIWASWCPPCRAEMPDLFAWAQAHPEVTMLVVSVDASKQAARRFFAEHDIDLPLLLTEESEAAGFGVRLLPSTFVIAGNGSIKRSLPGSQRWADPAFTRSLTSELDLN